VISIQPDGGHVGFCQNGGKNANHMALSTSGPNLVLLEESEPNSPFIALTALIISVYVLPMCLSESVLGDLPNFNFHSTNTRNMKYCCKMYKPRQKKLTIQSQTSN